MPIGFAGDVQVDVGRLSCGGPDLRFGCLAFRIQDIPKDHFGAFATKHFCFTGTLPAGAATNQGNLTIESSHDALLNANACSVTVTPPSNRAPSPSTGRSSSCQESPHQLDAGHAGE